MTRIKEAKSLEHNQNTSNSSNIYTTEFLFFIAINILAVGVSTYQTYVGYKADVAGNIPIAIAIALMSGILFLAMNFGIRQRRLDGQKHLWHVIMYIIPLGISFFGNFNAFYANQTSKDFSRQEVRQYQSQLTQTNDEAVQAIRNSVSIGNFKRDYTSALNQLEIEFNQPPVGWGRNAQERWEDITKLLNDNGGSISPAVIEGTTGTTRFNRAKAFADLEFRNILNAKQSRIDPALDVINDKYTFVHSKVDSLINLPIPIYSDDMLNEMVAAESTIRSQTSALLNREDIFSNKQLSAPTTVNAGTIKYTLQKAFIEREEPSATFFSLFFSLIIDLAGLLYIVVFIPYNRKAGRNRGGRMAQRI